MQAELSESHFTSSEIDEVEDIWVHYSDAKLASFI